MIQYILSALVLYCVMAHILPITVLRRLQGLNTDDNDNSESQGNERRRDENQENNDGKASGDGEKDAVKSGGEDDEARPYQPSPVDIVVVRTMLHRGVKLPVDIADFVLDLAEYWAHSSNYINYVEEQQSPMKISGTSPNQNKFLIRSYPVGLTGIYEKKDLAEELAYCTNESKPARLRREHEGQFFAGLADYPAPVLVSPVRKVVFTIRSHDQGWASTRGDPDEGPYAASWTWFEAGLERFDAEQTCDDQCTYDVRYKSRSSTAPALPVCALRPLHPAFEPDQPADKGNKYTHPLLPEDRWTIQRNKTAEKKMQEYVVEWSSRDAILPDSEAAQGLQLAGRGRETGDGEFVRSLRLGDVVTVWAKARFGGWVNHIESVKVDVYWAL
jgi:hypothetical protein